MTIITYFHWLKICIHTNVLNTSVLTTFAGSGSLVMMPSMMNDSTTVS